MEDLFIINFWGVLGNLTPELPLLMREVVVKEMSRFYLLNLDAETSEKAIKFLNSENFNNYFHKCWNDGKFITDKMNIESFREEMKGFIGNLISYTPTKDLIFLTEEFIPGLLIKLSFITSTSQLIQINKECEDLLDYLVNRKNTRTCIILKRQFGVCLTSDSFEDYVKNSLTCLDKIKHAHYSVKFLNGFYPNIKLWRDPLIGKNTLSIKNSERVWLVGNDVNKDSVFINNVKKFYLRTDTENIKYCPTNTVFKKNNGELSEKGLKDLLEFLKQKDIEKE